MAEVHFTKAGDVHGNFFKVKLIGHAGKGTVPEEGVQALEAEVDPGLYAGVDEELVMAYIIRKGIVQSCR
jgi:hypothetical protein